MSVNVCYLVESEPIVQWRFLQHLVCFGRKNWEPDVLQNRHESKLITDCQAGEQEDQRVEQNGT
jgi:hypothetical protein